MDEALKLAKEYYEFMNSELSKISSNEETHIHPAPAWASLYGKIIENSDEVEYIDDDIVIPLDQFLVFLDLVARFSSYQTQRGKPYDIATKCDCFKLTIEDLDKLREEVV